MYVYRKNHCVTSYSHWYVHETRLTNFVLSPLLAPDSEARCGRTTLPICTLFVGTVPTEANV